MPDRLGLLRERLASEELDALLVSQPENRRYLSGFTGSAGFLLVSNEAAVLATDFRYVEQARAQAPDFEVVRVVGAAGNWLPPVLARVGAERIGFEQEHLTYSTYREFTEALSTAGGNVSLLPTSGIVAGLRAFKDSSELESLRKAAALADAALNEVTPNLAAGLSEREVAWRLERYLRENGSEVLPFEIIVASGPNAALPHTRPSDRPVAADEPVVIDLGARVEGYCSDMTRTLCLGSGDSTFHRIYDIVLGAQETALATIQEDMTGEQADQLARTVVSQAGYEEAFGHGLGHGVGLAAHEEPRLGPGSKSVVSNGMVFTVEPGIYLSGWGGVRIEDTVLLKDGKTIPLTRAEKTWR